MLLIKTLIAMEGDVVYHFASMMGIASAPPTTKIFEIFAQTPIDGTMDPWLEIRCRLGRMQGADQELTVTYDYVRLGKNTIITMPYRTLR
jgi:hypothetical protein